jgi:hypothetical protein
VSQRQGHHSYTITTLSDIGVACRFQVWNMVTDMTDGFSQLSTAYQNFVNTNMNAVKGMHTAIFVIRWGATRR